jgi:hypothetical protein
MTDIRTLGLQWQAAKNKLDIAKADELKARNQIAELFFKDAVLGVNRVSMDDEHDLKLTRKENINFKPDPEKMEHIWINSRANHLVIDLFVKTFKLNEKVYKSLPEELRKIVDAEGMITITDAAPAIEICEKKKSGSGVWKS